jgi:hypothetical protein
VMEEFTILAADPGIELYVHNEHPKGLKKFPGEKILRYVHGATYLSETTFDLKLNGLSWMEFIAQHCYDVYSIDIRGYGRSTRPPEMDEPAADNAHGHGNQGRRVRGGLHSQAPWRLEDQPAGLVVGYDHHGLVHHAEQRQGQPPGAVCAFMDFNYAIVNASDKRIVSREAAKSRWLTGVAEDKRADLIPAGWIEAWADATFATDPVGAKQTPQVLRAPNGVVQGPTRVLERRQPNAAIPSRSAVSR